MFPAIRRLRSAVGRKAVAGHSAPSYSGDMSDTNYKYQSRGQLVAGLFMVAVGVLFLLERLDVIEFRYFARDFWPVILIVIGISRLIGGPK